MEAPEKIYLQPSVIEQLPHQNIVYTKPLADNSIEYTRTDAFIEKACEYFRRGLEDTKVIDDYRNIVVRGIQASYTSVEEFIENFVNYMKGE